MSATNDAGKILAHYNFATTKLNGGIFPPQLSAIPISVYSFFLFGILFRLQLDRIPIPEVFPENELSNNIVMLSEQTDWVPTAIVGIAIVTASLIV